MSNPWAFDETPTQIFIEESWLQGTLLSNIAYGVELTLFVMCFALLIRQMNSANRKRQYCLLAFITSIFMLGTIFMGANARFTQLEFIEDRNYPGGPGAYGQAMFMAPDGMATSIAFVVGNWIMDGFLVWRFMVIFQDYGKTWLCGLMVLPCLMLVASIALGMAGLIMSAGSSVFSYVTLTLAYYIMSVSLNVIVTISIAARLLLFRRRMSQALGPGHKSSYASMAAMLVESAAIYSVFGILFMVPFGLNYPLGNVFFQCVNQIQTVSSLLIIFRVATGRAWSDRTTTQAMTVSGSGPNALKNFTSIQFATGGTTTILSGVSKDIVGLDTSREMLSEHENMHV